MNQIKTAQKPFSQHLGLEKEELTTFKLAVKKLFICDEYWLFNKLKIFTFQTSYANVFSPHP